MEERKGQSRYKAIALFFAILLGIYFISQIPQIVLLFLLTLLFAIVLSGPVNYLADRLAIPRGLGILIVFGGLILLLWLLGRWITPVISYQARQFIEDFPTLLGQIQGFITSLQSTFGLENVINLDQESLFEAGRNFLSGHTTFSSVVDVGRSIAEAASLSVVALIVTVYLVAQPSQLIHGFVSLFPARQRGKVQGILGEMYHAVQKWVIGQLIAMIIIGILTTIALAVIGIPYAIFIGALSGLLVFIPLLGVLLSIIPPIFLALAINPILVVWVLLSYVLIHQIEAHVIQPVVMSRAVSLHPVVVVFAILIMGTLFGLIGLLLAIPLVAALSVVVRELWVARMDKQGPDTRTPPPDVGETLERTGLLGRLLSAVRRS
ncbi:MAG: AI-2E family transporter [Rubrobacter sp.]|nr:AI-2E family transporter [Rubrobacter sp.]